MVNDLSDLFPHHMQEQGNWTSFEKSSFADCYVHEEALILFRLRDWQGQEFLASVQRDGWRSGTFKESDPALRSVRNESQFAQFHLRRFFQWAHSAARLYQANGQQQPMFVRNVPTVQRPEERVASLIWCDTAENFERTLLRAVYHSQTSYFPVVGMAKEWELGLGSNFFNQATSDVVQGPAQAVEHVADDHRDHDRHTRSVEDVIRYIARADIFFDPDAWGINLPPVGERDPQILDVLTGPIVLR